MPDYFLQIENVVETLENAKKRGKKCTILIGAGCSVAAGIPTAQGLVNTIKERYPLSYERAEPKTYTRCMAILSEDEQRDLIVEFVDKAKVNWGHIALAQLMKAGYIDRVLTTNFDPLVMRACALVGLYPAIYDLATSQYFEPHKVPDQAIFHLHGQRTGFVLLNSEKALTEHSAKLAPVFEDAGRGRVWLVVGYSGESDPVFDHLAKVRRFDNRLYWIGYMDNEPAPHLNERLLIEDKDAYFVKGFDADGFFITLAQKLGCFPPDFVGKPFSYVDELFNSLTEFSHPTFKTSINYIDHARKFLHNAIANIENIQSDVMQALANIFRGDLASVISLEKKYAENIPTEVKDILSLAYGAIGTLGVLQMNNENWKDNEENKRFLTDIIRKAVEYRPDNEEALVLWGIMQFGLAEHAAEGEADKLYRDADETFSKAAIINPNNVGLYLSWGRSLSSWAKYKSSDSIYLLIAGTEVDNLYERSNEKFSEVARINPDFPFFYYVWGEMLADRARNKQGDDADMFFKLAEEKYAKAIQSEFVLDEQIQNLIGKNMVPEHADVYEAWGNLLFNWALRKDGEEAVNLFRRAGEKYQQVVSIRSESFIALYNLGRALYQQALGKDGADADELFKQSTEKHIRAKEIDPTDVSIYDHLGITLFAWAQTKNGMDADEKYAQAGKYYSEAISIQPDYVSALTNWGGALFDQAKRKSGNEAEKIYRASLDKYERATLIESKYDYFTPWFDVLAHWAQTKNGSEKIELIKQTIKKYEEVLRLLPNNLYRFSQFGDAICKFAQSQNGMNTSELDELYEMACSQYMAADKLNPDDSWTLGSWGWALFAWAKLNTGAKADDLYKQSIDKYERQVKIDRRSSVLKDWSLVLDTWAQTKSGEEASELSKQAEVLRTESSELLEKEGDLSWLLNLSNNTNEGEDTV